MAESQKGASSHLNSKERTSLLDLDFGKDFLSSWKSMSVAEDDAMDFDFGTVAKGKKKAFSFGKLDVDFSLDGDLDKISSFKVDMSDLDISLPTKSGKHKERSKGESAGGNHQEKQECFSLPFDFNELDGFSFESSLKKEVQNIGKDKDNEESSNRNECQTSRMDFTDGIAASEYDGSPKLAMPRGVTTSKTETMVDAFGDGSINKNFPGSSTLNDNGPSNSAIVQVLVASEEAIILPEKTTTTNTQEIDEENHHQEEKTSPESCAQKTMQDLSIQSVPENDSTRETASELQVEVCSAATRVTSNVGREQNVNFKSVAEMGLNCDSLFENLVSQDVAKSLSKDGKTSGFGSDNNVSIDNINGIEPAQGYSDSEGTSTTSVSGESMHNTRANGNNKNVNAELCLTPLSSGTSVAKSIQMKEKETGVSRSKYFKSSDEKESQSKIAPPTQTKITMFGRKTIGSRQLIDEGRDGTEAKDAQRGSKLVRISTSLSTELNTGEPRRAGSMRSFKDLHSIGESSDADGVINGSKLIGSSSIYDREVTKSGPVQGNERNVKNLMTLSSSEQSNRSARQNSTTSGLPALSTVSIKNSNNICGEGNKTSPLKTDRSLPDLSIFKISRTTGVNHHTSNYTLLKQIKSLGNTKKNMEQGITGSVATHSVGTEKQISPTPTLKRKAFEASIADMPNLNPSKRLSQSASESRNIREVSETVVDKKVCSHADLASSKTSNVLNDFQTSALEIPHDMNTKELEIPLVMEKDDNVEKAEAYTKELEDICNMLKKKHEEAKELLVRAIVNNNNLLMLNHPIYDEKIRKVQKFAAQLMSKELHA